MKSESIPNEHQHPDSGRSIGLSFFQPTAIEAFLHRLPDAQLIHALPATQGMRSVAHYIRDACP